MRVLVSACVLILCATSAAHAASPALETVVPRGAQKGTEVEVTFRGARLADAEEVLLYGPGLTVTEFKAVDAGSAKAKVKVAPDAKLGEHSLRVRCKSGITELRTFYVGAYPDVKEVAEVDPNRPASGRGRRREVPPPDPNAKPVPKEKRPSTFDDPQEIDLNVTVSGVIENEQADFYVVDCKQGQRLTAEVEAMRLGTLLDPHVTILDTNRFELAASDDTALFRQDCVVSVVVPKDGSYIIQVRESSYGGGPTAHYRMHVGTFPRPRAVYPAGGKAGEEVEVKFLADVKGEIAQKIKAPATPGEQVGVYAEQDGLIAPSPNAFRVSAFPNVMEAEPNDEAGKATVASSHDVPVALNGIIEKDGDVDFFKFKAAKGQALDIGVYARRVRSPLDPVLVLYNAKGGQVAANDDSGGPDAYLRFGVPEDGEYVLSVRDHLKGGGPDYVYRVEITKPAPALALSIPNTGPTPTQERQTIVVPKGNRFGTLIRAARTDVGGAVQLEAQGLPEGVKMHAEPVPDGQDVIPVVFEAAADAPVAGKLCDLLAKPAEAKVEVAGAFVQAVDLVIGPNNAPYYSVTAKKLAVAVADEVPFTVKIVQPKVPLVQSGSMELKVVAERKGDFKGPINLRMLWDPPGVGAGQVTIPPDKNEIVIPLNAQPNAAAKKHKIAVLGQSDVNGPVWVSTPLAELEVAPAYFAMKLEKTAVDQGQGAQVLCKIDPKAPFEGKAKVQLLGLPNEATAPEVEIGKDDKQVIFNVATTAKSPPGTHSSLMCRVTLVKDGEPIVHNLAQGGVLRIDPPAKPKEGQPAQAAAKPDAAKAPGAPLSRLDKLRQEQGQK